MQNSKKTILISLIPAMLTLYFIAQVLYPSVQKYLDSREKFHQGINTYKETMANIEGLKNNKKLLEEMQELNEQASEFDIEIPQEFQDEYFIVDLNKFSLNTSTKIISLSSNKEKEMEISTSSDKKQKSKRKKHHKEEQPLLPLSIWEKPFQLKTLGHYSEVISFIDCLEGYQRKFIINGISAQISKNDDKNPNPKIEITIEGSTYRTVKNPEILESEENQS